MLGEITYPFPNFNGVAVEVWEWISNFSTHFSGHVSKLNHITERAPCWRIYTNNLRIIICPSDDPRLALLLHQMETFFHVPSHLLNQCRLLVHWKYNNLMNEWINFNRASTKSGLLVYVSSCSNHVFYPILLCLVVSGISKWNLKRCSSVGDDLD